MFDIHWTSTTHVPELLMIGDKIVAELQGIKDEITKLVTSQAAVGDAIAAQLTAIADELSQLDMMTIQQADLDALAAQIRAAATTATDQAAQIRANSAQIGGLVPDVPPAVPLP